MKGMIELYYDMPHLATYLAASGAHFSENQLKNEICEFLEDAVLHHIEEKKFIIMGTLTEFLEGKEIVVDSPKVFRRLPTVATDIYFDTDMMFLEEGTDYLAQKEKTKALIWQATGKRGQQDIHRTTCGVHFEMDKEQEDMTWNTDLPTIFLDFDGVLNTDGYYAELMKKGAPTNDRYGALFDPAAVENLRKIVDATHAQIVVSSSWRHLGLEELQMMWHDRNLPGKVVALTPMNLDDEELLNTDLSQLDVITADMFCSSRGREIQAFFHEAGYVFELPPYVILDDLKDVLPEQEDHFIRIDPIVGITEDDAEKAVEILNY